MRNAIASFVFALFVCGYAGLSSAHGGGLDKYGCHTNRKTGEYHCHRGGSQTPTNTEAVPQSGAAKHSPPTQIDNTCYTGPRGGRYRIINGRKRYGC